MQAQIFTFFRQKISRKTPKKTYIPLKLNTLLLILYVVQYTYKTFQAKMDKKGEMTNYRAILQYHYAGNTTTQIAKLCECSRTTVLKTIKRAKECGIDEPAFELLSDIQLLERLYPKRVHRSGYEEPDFIALEKDKKKRGLTVFVMWRRYYKRTLAAGKKPYGKSQFFKLFKRYDTGSFRFEFQYTETMKKVSALISDYVCIPSRLGEGVKRAAKERFHLWCKKMRLDPQKI